MIGKIGKSKQNNENPSKIVPPPYVYLPQHPQVFNIWRFW